MAWLTFPVMGAQTNLVTDASKTTVAGVLQQVMDGEAKPLAFFSKSLNKAQRNYSAFDACYLFVSETLQIFSGGKTLQNIYRPQTSNLRFHVTIERR